MVGFEAEVPYFFKESEPHSSLIGSLFFKCLFGQKFFVFSQKMYRHSFLNLKNIVFISLVVLLI